MRRVLVLGLLGIALVGCGGSETSDTRSTREWTTLKETGTSALFKPGYCGQHEFGGTTGEIVQVVKVSCDRAIAILGAKYEHGEPPPSWRCAPHRITDCFYQGNESDYDSGSSQTEIAPSFQFRPIK
jgi:hypothetical protein